MRILLDECLPRRLKRDLVGHEAKSVPEMGWAGKTNGALLTVAQTDFDVLLTVDRNLSFQQDINKFNLAVVVLVATSNDYAALQPLRGESLKDAQNVRPRCHNVAKTRADSRGPRRTVGEKVVTGS